MEELMGFMLSIMETCTCGESRVKRMGEVSLLVAISMSIVRSLSLGGAGLYKYIIDRTQYLAKH